MIESRHKFNSKELDIEMFRQDSIEDFQDTVEESSYCYRKPLIPNVVLFILHIVVLGVLIFALAYFTQVQPETKIIIRRAWKNGTFKKIGPKVIIRKIPIYF
ncbi:uncharacterized protein LOC126747313 [Anthonomus grandis grandis]|uniref:uncharacterized protein LOC126747313 n=1 Tax=Anthonomus grandis grandis TaxID=2921223 RepID=UPI0021653FBA|nr:uncharacterized protein LOC126747313 [Anthonomus grandis grandis]